MDDGEEKARLSGPEKEDYILVLAVALPSHSLPRSSQTRRRLSCPLPSTPPSGDVKVFSELYIASSGRSLPPPWYPRQPPALYLALIT